MKKLLVVVVVVIAGIYLFGSWATDPETIEEQEQKLQAASQKLNNRMIEMAEEMNHDEIMQTVGESKKILTKMIEASSGNSDMEQMFQDKLNALNNVKSKQDYISYLKNN